MTQKIAIIYTLAIILAFVAGLLAGYLIFNVALDILDKIETVECNELVEQSNQFDHRIFYVTKNQKEQCDTHGIEINAPVK